MTVGGMREPFSLSGFLEEEAERVEEALSRAAGVGDGLPDAVEEAVRHGLLPGGKRLRPILCVAAYRACGGREDPAVYDLAASVELIHAYSLIHDDLPRMDDAALRRGRPTTHRVHGESAAVLAGAALIPRAGLVAWRSALALGVDEDAAGSILRELTRAAGVAGMVGGQALDLMAEGRRLDAPSLDDLHRRKTGALLTASLQIGALAAGARPEERAALGRYGRSVGLAFQIADDLLDATGSPEVLGKQPSDEALGKSTYVALHGLRGAWERAREEVTQARAALDREGMGAPALHALAEYVVERRR